MKVNMVRHLSSLRLACATLLTVVLAVPLAHAQDDAPAPGEDEAAPTPEELGWVPHYRVVGFQDREGTGDCDRAAARYGECIELVDFVPYELIARKLPVWFDRDSWKELLDEQADGPSRRRLRRQRRAVFTQWRSMSELYAQMWEDMVYRWQSGDDPGIANLKAGGYKVFPQATAQWDASYPGRARVYSMPEHSMWLQGSEWLQPFYSQLPQFESEEEEIDDTLDSDNDGLTRAQEDEVGTSDNRPDSDADGWSDGEEITNLTDPLDPDDFPQIVRADEGPFYRLVRYAVPVNQQAEPPPTALLSGRFALRLGFDGRLHDYDLMDADQRPSGPFFEQMFPYKNIYRGVSPEDEAEFIPLIDFNQPDSVQLSAQQQWDASNRHLRIDSFEATQKQSATQFDKFYRLVGSQIAQFAMEDYTVNHMRILGALTMMRSPPGSKRGVGRLTTDINASGVGQTDTAEDIADELDTSVYAIQGGFALRYTELPETLLNEWIQRLVAQTNPGEEFYSDLNFSVRQLFNDTVRPSSPPIMRLDNLYLQKWLDENRVTGEPTVMRLQIKQLAVQLLMERLPQTSRDVVETYLLLDHLDETIYQGLSVDALATPADVAGLTSDSWQGVLAQHNYSTSPMGQGLNAIDPTAVCTTAERLEALGQPSIGVVFVDQLFAATDDPSLTPSELLWEAREELPFLMLDNPVVNEPKVEKLVGLPSGLAMYRARWTVWSGWHFFWDVEPFADAERLVLRTGAVCEDMVLAPPDLVPTIVRGGLLIDDFRPTEAARIWDDPVRKERRRQRRQRRNPDSATTTDDAVQTSRYSAADAQRAYADSSTARAALEEPSASTADQFASTGLGLFDRKQERRGGQPRPNQIAVPDAVEYVRGVVRAPLEEMAGEEEGLLLVVFDSTAPKSYYGMRNLRPRTPYARKQKRVSWGRWIRTANWAMFLDADTESDRVATVSPSYQPTPSVETDTVVQRWKRNRTWDANFAGGVGFFPLRQVQYTCNSAVSSFSSTRQCAESDYVQLGGFTQGRGLYDRTEGFGLDFSTFATWWLWDEPRLALEMGLEARADFLHPGTSWFYQPTGAGPDATNPDYSFVIRPQGGALFGIRSAPDPWPMYRLLRRATPWGANGPDGSSYEARQEVGLRGGFLVGPGYNGLEGTVLAEVWMGNTIRRRYSPWSSFTPYHPIMTGNFYVRGMYGFTMLDDTVANRSVPGYGGQLHHPHRIPRSVPSPSEPLPDLARAMSHEHP